MDAERLYEQIKEMIYKDTDRAEKMLLDADNNKLLDNDDLVYLTISLGAQLGIKDEFLKSREILHKALNKAENDDNRAEAYKYLALSFYYEENYNEALKLYERALNFAKDEYIIGSIYAGMAGALYGLTRREESLKYYLKSLDYFDESRLDLWGEIESSITSIITAYLYLDDKEKADVYIDKLIKNTKSSSQALHSIYYDLGHYYYRRKEWGRALENYKFALSHFHKEDHDILADIYEYIGSCYHNLGELKEAKIFYQKSIEFTDDKDEEQLKRIKETLKIVNETINKKN